MQNPGFIFMDCAGLALSALEREMLAHPVTLGVVLFSRNYESIKQLKALTQAIKQVKPGLIISVDQEGGRVQRFKNELTKLPAMQHWGDLYKTDPNQAKTELQAITHRLVTELQDCGVDVTWAPVLDIDYGENTVIGDRSFGALETVLSCAEVVIDAFHQSGMPVTGKHFPGHGGVAADSHVALPIDTRDWDTLWEQDMRPFRAFVQRLDAIMPAHVIYEQVDSNTACFSSFWLREVLREKLGFEGIVVSDDLSMAGAASAGSLTERAGLALDAGCDTLLLCNQPDDAGKVLEAFEYHQDKQSTKRILSYCEKVLAARSAITHSKRSEENTP